MTTLTVTRALVSGTNPTETQLDSERTSLLNYFNAASMDEDNVATGGMLLSTLANPASDVYMHWHASSYVTIGYDSGANKFKIANTLGKIIFGTRVSSTLTSLMELRSSDGALDLYGQLYFNTSVGAQDAGLLWLLARYRKPRLVYTDNDIVTAEANISTGSSIVMGRDRLWSIYDTTMSLAVTANGAKNTDTGTAVSGLANGLTRTANRWYFIYAVEVQYGTQADGTKAILVAHSSGPESGNIATLNTAFGTGKWVYMGMIRNGYNDGTNTNIIVPFVYDEGGYIRFTKGTASEGMGVTMASASASTSDLSYDLVFSNAAAATIPSNCSRAIFSGYRSKNGFEFYYRSTVTLENNQCVTACHHNAATLTTLVGVAHMEVPLITNYRLVVANADATSSNLRITLVGLLDHNV